MQCYVLTYMEADFRWTLKPPIIVVHTSLNINISIIISYYTLVTILSEISHHYNHYLPLL